MNEVMQGILRSEDIVVRGGINRYVGMDRIYYDRVHGGHGFGERHSAG